MIKRIYVNNFRCLVNFSAEFDSFNVLCGHNGTGKSSVFDALQMIRNLATGNGILGGQSELDIPRLEFTCGANSPIQELEVELTSDGRHFTYALHLEQATNSEKPRVVKEQATCDGKNLFDRDIEGVNIYQNDGTAERILLNWPQVALVSVEFGRMIDELARLKTALKRLLILRPNPRGMERESKAELKYPDVHFAGLTSWYRFLSGNYAWTKALHELLQDVWPDDFQSLSLESVGLDAKVLQFQFGKTKGDTARKLMFSQLSDGEKMLIGLYMIRAALDTGAVETVWIDEPDNYVGLPELQPWVFSMMELLDDERQVVLITHHPEILNSAGIGSGRYLDRDDHSSPTRMGPLNIPEGLSPGEAVTRGWVDV